MVMTEEMTESVSCDWIAALCERVEGEVLGPGDAGYDAARVGYNLAVDQRPEVIVLPESAADVAEAVRAAGKYDLGVAVMATGHGTVSPADGAMLIVMSRMRGVVVDPATQTAWIDAGTKWGDVLAAAQEHGLAPLLGSSPDIGAVGFTLGGGIGWLSRKYGLSTDSALAFDVVTADGRQLHVSRDENPDLFWGMRGGGGSLAIVTRMKIRLYPVAMVYAGNLLYPIEMAPEVLDRYADWITNVPEELTSSIVLMNFPPLPMAPEPLRGKSFVIVRGCYTGDLDVGAALIDGWREWREPALDFFHPMPFSDAKTISNDPEDPGMFTLSGAWLADLSSDVAETLMRFTLPRGGPPPLVFSEVRHMGGAISRGDAEGAAYGNRDSTLILSTVAITPTAEALVGARAHIAAFTEALKPHMTGGIYPNFLEGEEARDRIADAYSPETYRRLRALKAKWDPDNRLRFGFNITPRS